MEIDIKSVQGIKDLNDAVAETAARRERIDKIFRELAVYETRSIDDKVIEMFAAKVEEVRFIHPDLSEVEIYAIAGRLLKQLIACYQSALNQLLP